MSDVDARTVDGFSVTVENINVSAGSSVAISAPSVTAMWSLYQTDGNTYSDSGQGAVSTGRVRSFDGGYTNIMAENGSSSSVPFRGVFLHK